MVNILIASSEVTPFVNTGGLADVCKALPAELRELGAQVAVIMPAYRRIHQVGIPLKRLDAYFDIPIGGKIVPGQLLQGQLPDSDVPIYFVEQSQYFDRPELYGEQGQDYKDNCERFVFFCRAALETVRLLGLPVDLIHCHDWQTGLIPAYLKIEYANAAGYEQIASLLTIHNLAEQGQFWHWDMLLTGLDWKYFNWRQMEFFGHLNLLKTGLVFADGLTTLSPQYAREIQNHPWGFGLEGVLRQRGPQLTGILSGVNYAVWNPASDPHLAARYDASQLPPGKAACKAHLQRQLGLTEKADKPLIGLSGRLAGQPAWDQVASLLQRWLSQHEAQWVILGLVAPEYWRLVADLAQMRPHKFAACFDYPDALAHQIVAGADLLLMLSQYDPSGLNHMVSLKYGTLPIVRATGGLVDSITDPQDPAPASPPNGFSFRGSESLALDDTLVRACHTYDHDRDVWNTLVENGMAQDWSWARSARRYMDRYQKTIAAKRQSAVTSR